MYKIIIQTEDEYFKPLVYDMVRPIYVISNYGTIKNINTGRTVKPHMNNCGYMRVTLMTNSGRAKKFYVHRLVAHTFVINEHNLPEVNHITTGTEFKRFNYYENLEWVTASQNQLWSYINGHHSLNNSGNKINHYKGEDRYNAIASETLVVQICELLENGECVKNIKNILDFGNMTKEQITSLIHHIVKRNSWKHITSKYRY